MEDTDPAGIQRCRGLEGIDSSSCRLASDQTDALIFYKMIEGSDGIGTAAYTGKHRIRQPSFFLHDLFPDLL